MAVWVEGGREGETEWATKGDIPEKTRMSKDREKGERA